MCVWVKESAKVSAFFANDGQRAESGVMIVMNIITKTKKNSKCNTESVNQGHGAVID